MKKEYLVPAMEQSVLEPQNCLLLGSDVGVKPETIAEEGGFLS